MAVYPPITGLDPIQQLQTTREPHVTCSDSDGIYCHDPRLSLRTILLRG